MLETLVRLLSVRGRHLGLQISRALSRSGTGHFRSGPSPNLALDSRKFLFYPSESWYSRYSAKLAYLVGALSSASAYGATVAYCDASQGRLISWDEVLHRLEEVRYREGGGTLVTYKSKGPGESSWEYGLEFYTEEGCDLFGIVATLLAGFGGKGTFVGGEESPTRLTMEIEGRERFRMKISLPRWGASKSRIELQFLQKDEESVSFTEEEVECLTRAYERSRKKRARKHEGSHSSTFSEFSRSFGEVPFDPREVFDEMRRFIQGTDRIFRGEDEFDDDFDPQFPTEFDDEMGREVGSLTNTDSSDGKTSEERARHAKKVLEETFGVRVYESDKTLNWDVLAGYEDVKKHIDDTLTLPMQHPEVYDRIVRCTRERYESNRPKAVLFEGPPGCGKTSTARILASKTGIPFVHVPVESIMSKWYGEATQRLGCILKTTNELGRCIIFVDEIDALATSRDDNHEESRRLLSVLLQHIDGLEGNQNSVLVAATNRRDDLDVALLSRFDVVISFPLPDLATRSAILARYAKHLGVEELDSLALRSAGFSGRELQDACEEAERSLAGRLVRSKVERLEDSSHLPAYDDYLTAIEQKAEHAVGRRGINRQRSYMGAGQ